MDQRKVFSNLNRAHRLIGKITLRLAISDRLTLNMPELEEELAESVALVVAAHQQMRRSNPRV